MWVGKEEKARLQPLSSLHHPFLFDAWYVRFCDDHGDGRLTSPFWILANDLYALNWPLDGCGVVILPRSVHAMCSDSETYQKSLLLEEMSDDLDLIRPVACDLVESYNGE